MSREPASCNAPRPTSKAKPGGWTRNQFSSPARDQPSMRSSPKRSSTLRMTSPLTPSHGGYASDLPVQPAAEGRQAVFDRLPVRLDQPQRRRHGGEQRVAVLGREAETIDLT